jgi:hypothetical protein
MDSPLTSLLHLRIEMHAGRRLESDAIIGDLIERACDASELKLLLLKAAFAALAIYKDDRGGETVDCRRVL